MDTESLADALHALADSLRSAALDVDVFVHGHTASLDPEERTVIYRVLQEALSNVVVRH